MTEETQEQAEQIELAEELAEAEVATADVLAGIVGDEFAIEMINPWGERWIWVKVDPELAQEIFKQLGDPVTVHRIEDDTPPEKPPGDDPRAGHPTTRQM